VAIQGFEAAALDCFAPLAMTIGGLCLVRSNPLMVINPRHREARSDVAIQGSETAALDCFAALAMTSDGACFVRSDPA
jgi:hypothetical protein